jgi:hypothetical protein
LPSAPGPLSPIVPFLLSWPKPTEGHRVTRSALNRSPSAPLPPQSSRTGAAPPIPLPCRSLFNFEEPSPLTDSTRRRPVTSLVRSPPYKRHPRAPSPHHLPIPRIGSLHPCPYCPPIELCHHPSIPHRRWLTSGSPPPTLPSVRTNPLPSPSRTPHDKLPWPGSLARRSSGESLATQLRWSMLGPYSTATAAGPQDL